MPRSKFHKKRSWWRPALVAFNISFGNDICWYPLSYYHRDPYARNYRHYDRRPGYGGGHGGYGGGGGRGGGGRGGGGGGGNDRDNDPGKTWRGVTRVPRRDFGNPDGRGRGVEDERVARNVVDASPQNREMPRREGFVGTIPGGDTPQTPGRRIRPEIEIPDRSTGAAERAPGVQLDEDLRRSRVFRGRDPRPVEPRPTETTDTSSAPAPETRPTGVVVRPEPREDRPGRVVRPVMPDGVEKRERNRVGIGRDSNPSPPPSEPRTV